ncbi:MAG TPA: TolC family protein [Candidatus Binataceae bacterium]|nr:TolC family protein [Candidatus Binataceae bacterium]
MKLYAGERRATRTKLRLLITMAALVFCFVREPPARAAGLLTLHDAISRALVVAPSIASAAAASDLGMATLGEARAPLYPSLDGGLNYYQAPGYNPTVTNGAETAAQLTLNYTAYDFGRRLAVMRAARYAADAARLGVRAAQSQIVFDTTVAYYDLMRSRRAVSEWRASFDRLGRYIAVITHLERSGQAVTTDVLRIRSERDNAELQLAAAEQASRRAAIVLGSLIGEFDPADIEIENPTTLPTLPSGNLKQNPTLRADQRNIDAATLAIKAAQAERYPNLGLQFTTGFLGLNPPKTFGHDFGASYAGSIGMPIFDGGLIRAHIDAARARQMTATAQLHQDELILSQRLADARVRYGEALRQLDILNRSLPTAEDSFALDWTRFLGGGSGTLLEVIDAFRQAQTFRLTRIDQEFAVRQAAAETALLFGVSR